MIYDVIIVGGNIAGLWLGHLLNRSDLKVLVLERNKSVLDTFLGALFYTEKESKEYNIEKFILNKTRKVEIRFIDSNCKEYSRVFVRDDKENPIIMLDEHKLKLDLLDELKKSSNVDIKLNSLVTIITEKRNRVEVELKNKTKYSGKVIVGADGCNSIVAKIFNFPEIKICNAYRYILENCDIDSNNNLFYINLKQLGIGYAWLYPRSKTTCNFGIGSIDRVKGMTKYLMKLKANLPGLKNSKIKNLNGGQLPVSYRRNIVKGRVMLLGNAAGQINPLIGGGVKTTMDAAAIIADVLKKSKKQEFDLNLLKEYEKKYFNSDFGKDIIKTCERVSIVLKLNTHPWFADVGEKFIKFGNYEIRTWSLGKKGNVLKFVIRHLILSLKLLWIYLRTRNKKI